MKGEAEQCAFEGKKYFLFSCLHVVNRHVGKIFVDIISDVDLSRA